MSQPEEKLVKIVDSEIHSRGASVIQEGLLGALVVASVESSPMDSTQKNAVIKFSSVDDLVDSTMIMTKEIGEEEYRRTFSYNSQGEVLEISAWEEVI